MTQPPTIEWEPLPAVPPRPGMPAPGAPPGAPPSIIWEAMPPMDDGTRRAGLPNIGQESWDERVANSARAIAKPIKDYLTVDPVRDPAGKRLPETGEIPLDQVMTPLQSAGTAWAQILEGSPEKRAEAFRSRIPGATVTKDEKGNVYLDLPADLLAKNPKLPARTVMNQPGPSWQDLVDLASGGMGMALTGGAIGTAKTALGLGLRVGLFSGADTAISQAGSMATGTGRVPSAADMVENSVFGAILGAGGHTLFNGMKALYGAERLTTRAGTLTPQAEALLKRYKVDTDALTPDAIAELKNILPKAINPAEAARLAIFRAQGVTPLKPDITQDPKARAAVWSMEKGGSPGQAMTAAENAVRTMRRETQPTEIATSASNLVGKLTGKKPDVVAASDTLPAVVSVTRGNEFAPARDRIVKMAETEKKAVDGLYNAARAGDAAVSVNQVSDLAKKLNKVATDYDIPAARKIAQDLSDFIQSTGGKVTSVNIEALEKLRTRIVNLGDSGIDNATKGVAGKMKREFDAWEQALAIGDMKRGTPDAVKAFMDARTARAQYGRRFEDDDVISAMLKSEQMADGTFKLSFQPSEIAEKVVSRVGRAGGDDMVHTINRLKTILGPTSEEMNAIRREVLLKMLEKGSGTFERDIRAFTTKTPGLADALFTKAELREMAQHGQVAKLALGTEVGVENKSATTHQLMRELPSGIGDLRTIPAALRAARPLMANMARGEPTYAPKYLLNATPDRLLPPRIVGAGAETASQEPENIKRVENVGALVNRGFNSMSDAYVRALRGGR